VGFGSAVGGYIHITIRNESCALARHLLLAGPFHAKGWTFRIGALLCAFSNAANAICASQPGADAGQDGEGWPDAQHFWGGP
jgi:hypothetical protein